MWPLGSQGPVNEARASWQPSERDAFQQRLAEKRGKKGKRTRGRKGEKKAGEPRRGGELVLRAALRSLTCVR